MTNEAWLILLGLVGLYGLHVMMWPMRKCWACGGSRQLRAPLSGAYRHCDACGGRGERPRWAMFRRSP